MTVSDHYQIIIIGGGPAGVATALHLQLRNPALAADTLLIEAQEYPRDKLCGGGMTVHGDEQLHRLGIELDVPEVTIDQLAFRLNGRDFTVRHNGAMRIYHRYELDKALAEKATERGLCLHTGERLQDLTVTADGVRVTTNKGTYTAAVVVGADGTNSTVRRKAGFESSQSTARLLSVVTPVDGDADPLWQTRTALFDFTCVTRGVQGYTWDFPTYRNGQAHMNRGIFDSGIAPRQQGLPRGNLKTTFDDWLAERGVTLADEQLKGHPVRWFNPQTTFARPRVLLAGDAAGVDTLFAEGISYAMEYGEIAAMTLDEAFAQQDFRFRQYRERLISHRLGRLLARRATFANAFYRYKFPPMWATFWWFASIAPKWMQQIVGKYYALLPEHEKAHQAIY